MLRSIDAYSKTYEKSKMELYMKIFGGFQVLTSFGNSAVLDVWQDTEYVSILFYACII